MNIRTFKNKYHYQGKLFSSKNYGEFLVLDYLTSQKIEIQFVKTGYKMFATLQNIKRGMVRDPYYPRVFGVGYIGEGDFKPAYGGQANYIGSIWYSMLQRGYSQKFKDKYRTYADCEVCKEWHNFQNFAKWVMENRDPELYDLELDKDIKIDGNKLYSPETCLFVPKRENTEKAHAVSVSFIDPNNERHNIYNISKFAKDNGLNASCLSKVKKGERKHHKGWCLA